MKTQSKYKSRIHKRRRNQTMRQRRQQRQRQQMNGGRHVISSPKIKYEKSNSVGHTLSCTKCNGGNFIVKTLTLGTKIKTLLGLSILDNRFKVFTCTGCGFVQMYSNNITCNDKQCDPLIK